MADRVVHGADGFTLSAAALCDVIDMALAKGIAYLWLDCWCYRQQPPWASEYNHDHFSRCLTAVMLQVDAVFWLPVSRPGAPGQYQYRVWCSFEASMVFLRRLPVHIAGHPLTRMQWALVAWGSYLIVPPCER